MKHKAKLLGIIGSHRKGGNSYELVKTVFQSLPVDYEIIELAESNIRFCDLCEQCKDKDCVLQDDFNQILKEMKEADGIVFSLPKYLFVSSKFLAFLERLNTVCHMRKHLGYEHKLERNDYSLFSEKPCCIFFNSGQGKTENEIAKIVADYIESLGLTLFHHDKPPHVGINIKTGDPKGEVLNNRQGIAECTTIITKMVDSITK
jgi:multimeric flavodoxin WrbA